PLDKIRKRLDDFEGPEDRERKAAKDAAAAKIQGDLLRQAAIDRTELATLGYTTRELRAQEAEREQARQAEVAQLWERLGKLDPAGVQLRRARADSAGETQTGALLRRARSADEFMRRVVAEDDRRREYERRLRAQAEIAQLERQVSGGGTITRAFY